ASAPRPRLPTAKDSAAEPQSRTLEISRQRIIPKQTEFGNRGTYGRLHNSQPDFRSRNRLNPNQPATPDAGIGGDFGPLTVLPAVEGKSLHPLAERKVFAQSNDVER